MLCSAICGEASLYSYILQWELAARCRRVTQWRHDAFHNNALSILASQLKVGGDSVLTPSLSTKTPFEPLSHPHPKSTCLKHRSRIMFVSCLHLSIHTCFRSESLKNVLFKSYELMLTKMSEHTSYYIYLNSSI